MSLINCPNCNKNVSTFAESCPHCGYHLSKSDSQQSHNISQHSVNSQKSIDREKIRKYFIKSPSEPSFAGAIMMMILGFAAALIGISLGDDSVGWTIAGVGLGIVLFLAGIVSISSKKSNYKWELERSEPKATDQEMDEWLELDKKRIMEMAVEKVGIIPELTPNVDNPLVTYGPQSSSRTAIGKDRKIRFSKYDFTIIFLSTYHMGAFICDLDFTTGDTLFEETHEYYYDDVVSVSTTTNRTPFILTDREGVEYKLAYRTEFVLSVSSGEKVTVTAGLPHIKFFEKGEFQISGVEQAIYQIRASLREKKGGIQHHLEEEFV